MIISKSNSSTIAAGVIGIILGAGIMSVFDAHTVSAAKHAEWQANGLEDECKSTLRSSIVLSGCTLLDENKQAIWVCK